MVQLLRDRRDEVGFGAHPAVLAAGRFFFRFRDAAFPLVFLGIILASRAHWPRNSRSLDLALNGVGIAVALSGQLLRALVIGLAYIRRGGKDRRVYADELVQDGIFAHSRNPLYLGNLLGLLGLLIIHNSWAGYLVGVPFFVFAYWAIVCAEEEYLANRFGEEFAAYCRKVPRFIPSFKGLSATVTGMQFDWRRLLRKEYGTTFSGLTAIFVLLLWDELQVLGAASARRHLPLALAIWLPLVAAYLVAFTLKKRGALGRG
jgi:protein-S-isoprenylcysteine O-methyltransferase Ste14